jgi:hypothetical protein
MGIHKIRHSVATVSVPDLLFALFVVAVGAAWILAAALL